MSTVFSKIIAGELPSHKIYEDDRVLAFLDIYPKNEGHTLVIPKKPVEFIWDMTDGDYTYLMSVVKKLGKHLRAVLPYQYVQISVVGTDVPHAHVHLIPFNAGVPFKRLSKRADDADLAKLAEKLRVGLADEK
ncbi:MAG: HIT family protein [Candidatus Nanosyncoccaceae bacterium]|jgi:histidine triad (HIT) family protein